MKIQLLLIGALLFVSHSARALDVKQRFEHLDTNNDGYLTHSELAAQPQLLNSFSNWDENQDNRISLTEFKNYLTTNLF
ncbi:EF-hand domain-containing protein [Pseudoalteromonas tetraodonis]|uniref:EF-hand domain-containing protein n=1 Tax=Pseudoalteromonas tetraodonis TaxID=43659 RepID=UPI00084987DC|nr:EF-hand domain-containing protein [Pseudoalteromonas tetraodonis]ODS13266.1 calcium dependent protein [Pseudoalteromonas tetraodonis]